MTTVQLIKPLKQIQDTIYTSQLLFNFIISADFYKNLIHMKVVSSNFTEFIINLSNHINKFDEYINGCDILSINKELYLIKINKYKFYMSSLHGITNEPINFVYYDNLLPHRVFLQDGIDHIPHHSIILTYENSGLDFFKNIIENQKFDFKRDNILECTYNNSKKNIFFSDIIVKSEYNKTIVQNFKLKH